LGAAEGGSTTVQHGVQSVGLNSSFSFEQVFELGQIEIYENIEGVPEVEATIERVLDGESTLYQQFGTQDASNPGQSLLNVGDGQKSLVLSVFQDDKDSNTGSVQTGVECTGMYIGNYSISINLDGPSTESCSLVGNDKNWATHGAGSVGADDEPPVAVMKRQSLNTTTYTSLPNGVEKVQSISVSVDFGREDLNELGNKYPFFRAATYPTEVTCEISYLFDETHGATSNDPDIVGDGGGAADKLKDVTEDQPIKIQLDEINPLDGSATAAYKIDLGAKNRLTGVSLSGGDAGGGNSTVTYSYSTYNELYVEAV
jgi:hypothetical protein